MKLSDVVTKIQTTKWTRANNFNIIVFPLNPDFASIINWDMSNEMNDLINISIIGFDTPNYTNAEIAEFIGNEWRYHVGRDEMMSYQLTFRDSNQMQLYRKFLTAYNKQKGQYFDKIQWMIQLYNSAEKGVPDKLLFETQTAIIESVSQLQYNHTTENQITEFSVSFKSQPPMHPDE